MKALRSKSIRLFDRQQASRPLDVVDERSTTPPPPQNVKAPTATAVSAPASPVISLARSESLTEIVLRLEGCIARIRIWAVALERDGLKYEGGRFEDAVRTLVDVHARLSDYRQHHRESHDGAWSGEARSRRTSGEIGRETGSGMRRSLDVYTVAEHLSTTTTRLAEYCQLVVAPLFKRTDTSIDGKKRLLQIATALSSRASTLLDLAKAIRC